MMAPDRRRKVVPSEPGHGGRSPRAAKKITPRCFASRRSTGTLGSCEVPRKPPDVQPADARTITTLEACIADLRSLLAKAEERAAEERSRCDRLLAETLVANARAARLEGELTALRSRPAPWWQRWRQGNGAWATEARAEGRPSAEA